MTRTRLGGLLMVLGAVGLALSLLADPIGLGSSDGALGWKQATGTAISAAVLVVGAIVLFRARRETESELPTTAA